VARSSIRLAAGVGVVAASLLTFGPVSAAVADDRDSGSHSSRDDRGRWDRGGKDNRLDLPGIPGLGDGDLEIDKNPALPDEGPLMRVGAPGPDQAGLAASENLTIAERSAAGLPEVVEDAGPSARSGSIPGRGPAVEVRTPRVTFGNGRPPIVRHRDVEPPSRLPVTPEVAPPTPPERVVIDLPQPPQIDEVAPPRVVPKLGVAQTSSSSDPMFGLAGLLLIPAVGAALGYRQARGAQDAARSGRP
jgi:hypothetical protein